MQLDNPRWIQRFETFVRGFGVPAADEVDPSPLGEFRSYWNANMGAVQRDVAQLLSGRRDYPFGGQAYLSAMCGSSKRSILARS